MDVDGKLPYTIEELCVVLDKDPTTEFVCSMGGVVGDHLSSSALCKGMMAMETRNITRHLPAPYMRIETNTDVAKNSVVCYGIPKESITMDREDAANINGKGNIHDDSNSTLVSVRLNHIPDEDIFRCSYNGYVALERRKQDMEVVNMCGKTAYDVAVETNIITVRYDCMPCTIEVAM
jgi:hypothetical protein